jgi:hypothetical protein
VAGALTLRIRVFAWGIMQGSCDSHRATHAISFAWQCCSSILCSSCPLLSIVSQRIISPKRMRRNSTASIIMVGISLMMMSMLMRVSNAFAPCRRQQASARRCRHTTATTIIAAASSSESQEKDKDVVKPDILQPFPPAADPMYSVRGPVGENDFVLSRTGEPTKSELSNENLLRILRIECSDLEVRVI